MKNQNSLKWIIKNSKGEIPKIFILSISNILLALVATVLALVSKLAIDSAQRAATASSNAEFVHYRNLIIFNCILILVVITSRLLLRVFTQSLTIRVQAKMEMKMRGRLFYSIMMKDYGKINKYHSGELMNRITSDVKIVTEGIISIVPDALYFLTQFVGAFVVLIIFIHVVCFYAITIFLNAVILTIPFFMFTTYIGILLMLSLCCGRILF